MYFGGEMSQGQLLRLVCSKYSHNIRNNKMFHDIVDMSFSYLLRNIGAGEE
jgi:hypothetical protein